MNPLTFTVSTLGRIPAYVSGMTSGTESDCEIYLA